MKREGYIYEKIYNKDNIRLAIHNASKRKKKMRIVRKVLENEDYYINEIHEMLKNKTYTPSKYAISIIRDGSNKKERMIHKPKFYPDQVIHWAMMLQTEHLFKRGMYKWTGASIKGRGQIYVKRRVEKWVKKDIKNTKYCLKLDIRKYYQSIDKGILKLKIRTIIKCRDTLQLFDKIVDSLESGIPIGNYTSQWFANFYLQELDHFIKERLKIKYYIRYMDDLVLLHPNKKELRKSLFAIRVELSKLGLDIKYNYQLFPIDKRPLDFVGYVFTRDKTFVRKRITLQAKRKSAKWDKNKNIKNARTLTSYYGHYKHSDSYPLFKKHFKDFKKIKKEISDYDKRVNQIKSTTTKIFNQTIQPILV